MKLFVIPTSKTNKKKENVMCKLKFVDLTMIIRVCAEDIFIMKKVAKKNRQIIA